MHCVNDDPNSVQFSDQAMTAPIIGQPNTALMDTRLVDARFSDPFGGGGMPGSYPLALNGYRMGRLAGMRAYALGGLRGLSETKAQADAAARKAAAAAKTAATQAANAAKALATAQAKAAAAAAKNPASTQTANLQKQVVAAQQKAATTSNAAQQKATVATTATQTAAAVLPPPLTPAQQKAAANKATAAAKKTATAAAKAPRAAVAAAQQQLTALLAPMKTKNAQLQTQIKTLSAQVAAKKSGARAPAKPTPKGMGGLLSGVLGFLFGGKRTAFPSMQARAPRLRAPGDIRRRMHGLGDPCMPTDPDYNPSLCGVGAPIQQVTIDPTTGLPTPIGAGPYGQISPLGAPAGGSDPTSQLILGLLSSGQSSTPPKGCTNPNSTKAQCVIYNAEQADKQMLMLIVLEIQQINQQNTALQNQILALIQALQSGSIGTGTGAQTIPPGYVLDANGNLVPAAGALPTQTPPPPGYYVDPSTGQLVPQQSPVYPTQQYAPQYPPVDPYSGQYTPGAQLPIPAQQPYYNPSTGQAVDPMYSGQQAMPQLPYAPGGGVPQPYDPNMAPQYSGMPSPSDPYGDVAQLPPGYDTGGGGGGGGDYIPQDIPVSYGPIAYNDYSSDVAQLPPGAYDTGGDGGDGGLPTEVDPYGDASMQIAPQQMMMAQQYQQTPSGLPQQGQQVVSQGAAPQQIMMTAPDAQGMGPLMTEDQGQIVADAFASDAGW